MNRGDPTVTRYRSDYGLLNLNRNIRFNQVKLLLVILLRGWFISSDIVMGDESAWMKNAAIDLTCTRSIMCIRNYIRRNGFVAQKPAHEHLLHPGL